MTPQPGRAGARKGQLELYPAYTFCSRGETGGTPRVKPTMLYPLVTHCLEQVRREMCPPNLESIFLSATGHIFPDPAVGPIGASCPLAPLPHGAALKSNRVSQHAGGAWGRGSARGHHVTCGHHVTRRPPASAVRTRPRGL